MKFASIAAAALMLALFACSKPAPAAPPAPVAAPAPTPPKGAEPAPAQAVVAAPAPAPAAEPAKAAAATGEAKPVFTTARGKVGDAKCRMCHKLQHDSWSASPHARKGLDCEGCHGGGSEFTKVMRDRTAAIAAGLVLPRRDFCLSCHKKDWQDAMFMRVHAHKVK